MNLKILKICKHPRSFLTFECHIFIVPRICSLTHRENKKDVSIAELSERERVRARSHTRFTKGTYINCRNSNAANGSGNECDRVRQNAAQQSNSRTTTTLKKKTTHKNTMKTKKTGLSSYLALTRLCALNNSCCVYTLPNH